MPILKKTKTTKKAPQIVKKPTRTLVKAKNPKVSKNPAAYYECMCHQVQKGIKPKKITQVAHECKTNALTINQKMSAQKTQAVQKIKDGYEQLGQGLAEFIKANK